MVRLVCEMRFAMSSSGRLQMVITSRIASREAGTMVATASNRQSYAYGGRGTAHPLVWRGCALPFGLIERLVGRARIRSVGAATRLAP